MKALILQMRGKEDASREIEQKEYLDYTSLQPSQVNFIDLFEQPDYTPSRLLEHDVLFVGGISQDVKTELEWPEFRFPFIHNLRAILRLAIDKKVPSLLSCGGYIIAGDMLGAKTLCKEEYFESGVYQLCKTKQAEKDVFLHSASDGMSMVSMHVKYFAETPPGTELMFYTNEYSERVPVHAFKVVGAPFYAFQGHPEVSCSELFDRVKPMMYRKHYFPKRAYVAVDEAHGYNIETFQAFCALEADTSEAQDLLKRFVALVEEGAFAD